VSGHPDKRLTYLNLVYLKMALDDKHGIKKTDIGINNRKNSVYDNKSLQSILIIKSHAEIELFFMVNLRLWGVGLR